MAQLNNCHRTKGKYEILLLFQAASRRMSSMHFVFATAVKDETCVVFLRDCRRATLTSNEAIGRFLAGKTCHY